MDIKDCDFSGYATRNDLLCADGRTIRKNAFRDNDGSTVPLCWMHEHGDMGAVLGHAMLENREDGVYAYCFFNDTEEGARAKTLVQHGDVRSLSIYANKLKQIGNDVVHGTIRELSLVLSGANPGAYIDFVMAHGSLSDSEEEDGFYAGYDENIMIHSRSDEIKHSNEEEKKVADEAKVKDEEKKESANNEQDDKDMTVQDVINTMNPSQKKVLEYLVGEALKSKDDEGKDDKEMKHNLFEQEGTADETVLMHDAMDTIIKDAKRCGTMKESFLAHAAEYGIENIDYLFPDAKNVTNKPEFIQREMSWVQKVMNGVHHTPFSRIKSIFADITEDEARAKGYIKGKLKKEEVFSLLKRTTTPTTIYKKQKLDRDDIIDITDFDVVTWLKAEMRMMLDEEIARAILIGDGRLSSDDDKINETNIRPIYKDADLYAVKVAVKNPTSIKDKIDAIIKSRKEYKGSGNPTLFTTEDFVTDCLLLEDTIGHKIYKNEAEVATALRVKEIVTVEVMEGVTREDTGKTLSLDGIIVNLTDYNVGADKGGAVNMFDDFDIDYNQQKYLIETRCSGALVKPYSALVIESYKENGVG